MAEKWQRNIQGNGNISGESWGIECKICEILSDIWPMWSIITESSQQE